MSSVKSRAEELLFKDLQAIGLEPRVGYQFHDYRDWAFDLAWPVEGVKLAVEIDGRGRHQRAQGERRDCQKHNAALEDGWRVLRYPASSVATAKRRALIVEQIRRVLCGAPCPHSASYVLDGDGFNG